MIHMIRLVSDQWTCLVVAPGRDHGGSTEAALVTMLAHVSRGDPRDHP